MGLAWLQGSELEGSPRTLDPQLWSYPCRFETRIEPEEVLLQSFWKLSFAFCYLKLLLCVGCFIVMSAVPAMAPEKSDIVAILQRRALRLREVEELTQAAQ